MDFFGISKFGEGPHFFSVRQGLKNLIGHCSLCIKSEYKLSFCSDVCVKSRELGLHH